MNQPDLNPKADVWSAAGTLLAQQNRAPRLTRLPDVQGARLSFAQERLWLLEQMEPGAPYYNVPLSWDIAGDLNVLALQRSLDSLVQRHEILRTSFPLKGSEPVQQINDWHPQLPVVDVSPAANPAKPAATDLSEFIRLPFDLANGPLLRARLYQRAPAEHCLVIVLHQMIFDGASL
ncbi:MAG TPA: condensation domain-containing protein, partial [Candidatus Dormibacteraeota bacterium]|nr:condensation domain-containing protein [Candidatus Dormibacteraeota bacterium]